MIRPARSSAALLAALLVGAHAPVGGQSIALSVGRYFSGSGMMFYRASLGGASIGGLGWETYGTLATGPENLTGRLLGVGGDLVVGRGGRAGPYGMGGIAIGVGTGDHRTFWSSWSAGLGYQVIGLGPIGLQLEGRYRWLTDGRRTGVELSVRLGGNLESSHRSTAPPPVSSKPPSESEPLVSSATTERDFRAIGSRAASVVHVAIEVMGTPYRWGGSSGEGFDCSGLIQFAYRQQGIELPRSASAQASAGQSVDRELAKLQAGDILTFSNSGGPVTHVGLYVGGGEFIHSATGGVQRSRLQADDPYGRWWWNRWVGVRRVLQGE